MTMELATALSRLTTGYYNALSKTDANPGGFGANGHEQNLPAVAEAIGVVGQNAAEIAGEVVLNGVGVRLRYAFDDTIADADPGAEGLRANNATPSAVTEFYLSTTSGGADVTAALALFGASDSTIKGQLMVGLQGDADAWALYNVTGKTDAVGYRKIAVTYVAGTATSPLATDGASLVVGFAMTGNKGDTGTFELTMGMLTGHVVAGGYNFTGVGTFSATSATIAALTATTITADFSTVNQAGEYLAGIAENATGNVTLAATDKAVRRPLLTGDVVLLVAGAPTPGAEWSMEVRTTQDGIGGRNATFLPANQLVRTDALDDPAWTKVGATISANATAGPDGQATADKLVEGAGSVTPQVVQAYTKAASAIAVVGSASLKAAERTTASVWVYGVTGADRGYAHIDLSDGSVLSSGSEGGFSGATIEVEAEGNGFYRVHVKCTTNTATTLTLLTLIGDSAPYIGDELSGIYVTNMQLTEGATPLGYARVGATRAGMVSWRVAADEIDFSAQAAGAEARVGIAYENDGSILIDNISKVT